VAHSSLRTNKTCLNCGFQVEDRFCSHCGQENTVPAESVGHLIGHFLSDITHYDSKFFTSIRDLLCKPGFLTLEYFAGRRVSYLNPIRMYIFISAIFFIILFGGSEQAPPVPEEAHPAGTFGFSQHLADSLRLVSKQFSGSTPGDSLHRSLYMGLAERLDTPVAPSTDEESLGLRMVDLVSVLTLVENKYHSIGEYDSIQASRPPDKKEGVIQRWFTHRMIHLRSEHPGRGAIVIKQNIGEDIPKIMFVLLPLFALYVSFLYKWKTYRYTQHLIFSLHFHCFVFIALALELLIGKLPMGINGFMTLASIFILLIYTYLTLALSRTYNQSLWLSAVKSFTIGLMYVITLILVNIGIGLYSFVLG
jgi:hypothetical protein